MFPRSIRIRRVSAPPTYGNFAKAIDEPTSTLTILPDRAASPADGNNIRARSSEPNEYLTVHNAKELRTALPKFRSRIPAIHRQLRRRIVGSISRPRRSAAPPCTAETTATSIQEIDCACANVIHAPGTIMHQHLLMHFRRGDRQSVPFLQAHWSTRRPIPTGHHAT
jgi:hypothetical protein